MDLPVPQTGSMLELQFLRLLSKLERIVVELDVHTHQSPLKFHSYVDALQEQLADLQNSKLSHLSAETLETYRQRVQHVMHQLGPASVPSFCKPISQQEVALDKMLQAASTTLNSTPPLPEAFSVSSAEGQDAPSSSSQQPTIMLSDNTKQNVLRNRKLQEELLDELADMAGALKSGAQAMQGSVDHRGELLAGTETALDKSVHSAKVTAQRAKQQYIRGKGSCCLTCMVFAIVALVFVNMMVFIKVSSVWQFTAGAPAAAGTPAVVVPQAAAAPAAPPGIPEAGHVEL